MTIPMKSLNIYDDLAYISLASALLNIAQDTEGGEGIVQVEEDAKIAQKINYRINKLQDRFLKIMRKHKASWDYSIKPRQEKLLTEAIQSGYDTLQPDYLAVYILRFRFIRSKRELHSDLQWLRTKGGDLLALMELLDTTKVADRDEQMCDMAFNIADVL